MDSCFTFNPLNRWWCFVIFRPVIAWELDSTRIELDFFSFIPCELNEEGLHSWWLSSLQSKLKMCLLLINNQKRWRSGIDDQCMINDYLYCRTYRLPFVDGKMNSKVSKCWLYYLFDKIINGQRLQASQFKKNELNLKIIEAKKKKS